MIAIALLALSFTGTPILPIFKFFFVMTLVNIAAALIGG